MSSFVNIASAFVLSAAASAIGCASQPDETGAVDEAVTDDSGDIPIQGAPQQPVEALAPPPAQMVMPAQGLLPPGQGVLPSQSAIPTQAQTGQAPTTGQGPGLGGFGYPGIGVGGFGGCGGCGGIGCSNFIGTGILPVGWNFPSCGGLPFFTWPWLGGWGGWGGVGGCF
jgi:hypothetical protein